LFVLAGAGSSPCWIRTSAVAGRVGTIAPMAPKLAAPRCPMQPRLPCLCSQLLRTRRQQSSHSVNWRASSFVFFPSPHKSGVLAELLKGLLLAGFSARHALAVGVLLEAGEDQSPEAPIIATSAGVLPRAFLSLAGLLSGRLLSLSFALVRRPSFLCSRPRFFRAFLRFFLPSPSPPPPPSFPRRRPWQVAKHLTFSPRLWGGRHASGPVMARDQHRCRSPV
jgi:hypothetical protein